MVKQWGMSDKVGLRAVEDNGGRSLVAMNELGPATNELMDTEIKRLLQESYDRAKNILKAHAKEHKALAEALLKYETLDAEDMKSILAGQLPAAAPKFSSNPASSPPATKPKEIIPQPGKRINPC